MKLSISKIIVFLFLMCSFVTAQEMTSEEILLTQVEAIKQLNAQLSEDYNSLSVINQVGIQNTGIVMQTNSTNNYPGNTAIIDQVGSSNSASINQTGNDINSEVLQVGDNNNYDGEIDGVNISSKVHQFGAYNNVEQDLSGVNLNYDIFQIGIRNEVLQTENGTGNLGPAYKVTQFGDGMKITITNGTIN